MRLDVDVAGAAATLPCRLVLIASGAVLILAVLAVNADESDELFQLTPLVFFLFCFSFVSFMVYAAVALFYSWWIFYGGMR